MVLFTDNYSYLVSSGTETVKCASFDLFGLTGLGKFNFRKFGF